MNDPINERPFTASVSFSDSKLNQVDSIKFKNKNQGEAGGGRESRQWGEYSLKRSNIEIFKYSARHRS